jgi:hypothetical protein
MSKEGYRCLTLLSERFHVKAGMMETKSRLSCRLEPNWTFPL